MNCPNCGNDKLVEIEKKDNPESVSRIYKCDSCGERVVSIETLKYAKRKAIK